MNSTLQELAPRSSAARQDRGVAAGAGGPQDELSISPRGLEILQVLNDLFRTLESSRAPAALEG